MPTSPVRSPIAARFPTVVRAVGVVRRRLLLHRRIVAGLCLGVATWCTLQVLRPPDPVAVEVLVAARDLPAGTRLGEADLRTVARAPDSVPDGQLDAAHGQVLASPVRRGEPITDARILGRGMTLGSPDRVALAVRITDAPAVDLVRVGDAVDVIAVPAADVGPESSTDRGARVLVSGARVLALPSGGSTAGSSPVGAEDARVVVLEVDRARTVEISRAAAWDWLTVALTQ